MEGHGLARNIKKSIFIRVNNLTLNKYIGKFNLPQIRDRVLLNTPGLTLKRHSQVVGQAIPIVNIFPYSLSPSLFQFDV